MKRTPDNLEAKIDLALRGLPDRRAPLSLEQRVLAEIHRRASLPWWRQSYAHWPLAVRAIFLVASASIAAFTIAAVFQVLHGAEAAGIAGAIGRRFAWMEVIGASLGGTAQAASDLYHAIPSLWLYGALAVFAAFYATLVGVGAAAYRAFSNRS